MNMSRKTVVILLILLASFSAGTFRLRQKEEIPEDEPERVYYLTAYESPEDLLAIQVANSSGTLTIVHHSGIWFTDTDMEGIEPDEKAAEALFEKAARIRVGGPVEGADPQDAQFGLTDPSCTILVEDVKEGGIRFLAGAPTPDGKARYVCADGGREVFTLSADYEEAFQGDIRQYLDLSVLSGLDVTQMSSLTVSDEQGIRFRFEETGSGRITGMKYYSLTDPVRLPAAAAVLREQVLEPLQAMRGETALRAGSAKEEKDSLTVSVEDEAGKEHVFLVGEAEGGIVPVTAASKGITYLVPGEELAWLNGDLASLLGGKLLSLNAGELEEIRLMSAGESTVYEITGSGSQRIVTENGKEIAFSDFTSRVLDPLNRIPIRMTEDKDTATGEEVLRCTILSGKEEGETELVFYEVQDRTCLICVNGKEAFLCDRSSIRPLA